MTVMEVFDSFPDQESCIKHLEKVRWGIPRVVHTVRVSMLD